MKFGTRGQHIMSISNCELREDRTLEHLLTDFDEIRYKRSAHNANKQL